LAVVATLGKGYDLDCAWKQIDQGAVKGASGYYIQASETGGKPPAAGGARARKRSASSPVIFPADSSSPLLLILHQFVCFRLNTIDIAHASD
jgi:hypothetical protein